MRRLTAILIAILTCASQQLFAGVVLEMLTKDGSGNDIGTSKIYAESGMVRLDNIGGNSDVDMSMIFQDNKFLMLNHEDKTYFVMDEAMLEEMNSQMSTAMRQMEAPRANVPAEQREMIERMMKGKMQGMMPQQAQTEQPRVEVGGTSQWRSYPCVKYTIYSGNEKTQEICAASMDQIEGAGEVVVAFRMMAVFMKKMVASMPDMIASRIAANPMEMMDQIDGFPVHTLQFEQGKLSQEASLESVSAQALEKSLFVPPGDYKKQDMFNR
jgi:hypothetical protein